MSQELELITKVENDRKWLDENFDEFRDEYRNEFVAVKDGKVIASNKDLEVLIKNLKERGENSALLLIKFIPEKGLTLIL